MYDYVDGGFYFSDQIGPEVTGNDYGFTGVWPFVNGPHQWTPGTHKFFGWLAKDANMTENNTPENFFGAGFSFSGHTDKTEPSDASYVLTIPEKSMTINTPQFDFMYSDIIVTEPKNEPVGLTFSHLFSAFYITGLNRKTTETIQITNLTISGLKNTKSAAVSYQTEATAVGTYLSTVTYTPAAGTGSFEFNFTDNGILGTTEKDLTGTYLIWPQNAEDFKDAQISIDYVTVIDGNIKDQEPREFAFKEMKDAEGNPVEWKPGKVNKIGLVFDVQQITFVIEEVEAWNHDAEQDIPVDVM